MGHRGATASSLLRWSGPWFCAQLAGSVAAGAEGTAGLESWGTFGGGEGQEGVIREGSMKGMTVSKFSKHGDEMASRSA